MQMQCVECGREDLPISLNTGRCVRCDRLRAEQKLKPSCVEPDNTVDLDADDDPPSSKRDNATPRFLRRLKEARIDAALPAVRQELERYASRLADGLVVHEVVTCGVCDHCYTSGEGGHGLRCPRCNPGIISFEDMLTDRNFWPGPQFVWSEASGPRGRWELLDGRWLVSNDEVRPVAELLPEGDPEERFFSALRRELVRLQTIAREVAAPVVERAEAEAKRAIELADECGRLQQQLNEKRVECDVLRDKLVRAELKAKGGA